MERARSSIKGVKGRIKDEVTKKEVRRESVKIFKEIDANGDKTASEEEIAEFVASNDELWSMLSEHLDLPRSECRMVATQVAMELASGKKGDAAMRAEIDRYQFHEFRKRYMLDSRGSREFFHRAVFAAFDQDKNGFLDEDELDPFLDIFYKSGSIFNGNVDLPPKDFLKAAILEKFDKDGNGQLDFREIRRMIGGKVEEVASMASKAEVAAKAQEKLAATRRAREPAATRGASKWEEKTRRESRRGGPMITLSEEDEEMMSAIEAARQSAEEQLADEAASRRRAPRGLLSFARGLLNPRASFAMSFNCYTAEVY